MSGKTRAIFWSGISLLGLGVVFYAWQLQSETGLSVPKEVIEASEKMQSDDGQQLVAAMNDFAYRSFAEIAKTRPQENLVYHPSGVWMLLFVASLGSDGKTAADFDTVLGLGPINASKVSELLPSLQIVLTQPDPGLTIELTNTMTATRGLKLKNSFAQQAQDVLRTKIESVTTTSPYNAIQLTNESSFDALWKYPFKPDSTYREEFTAFDGRKHQVPTMHASWPLSTGWNDTYSVVRLPYGTGRAAIYLFLPNEDSSLESTLAAVFSSTNWADKLGPVEEGHDIPLQLPKFNISVNLDLKDALTATGLKDAFGTTADFSKMSDTPLWITEAKQESVMTVNESGTKAQTRTELAAADAAADFMFFNKPFLFIITDDETGLILLMGVYGDPTSSN